MKKGREEREYDLRHSYNRKSCSEVVIVTSAASSCASQEASLVAAGEAKAALEEEDKLIDISEAQKCHQRISG